MNTNTNTPLKPLTLDEIEDQLMLTTNEVQASNCGCEKALARVVNARYAVKDLETELLCSGTIQGKNQTERDAALDKATADVRADLRSAEAAYANADAAHQRLLLQLRMVQDLIRINELRQNQPLLKLSEPVRNDVGSNNGKVNREMREALQWIARDLAFKAPEQIAPDVSRAIQARISKVLPPTAEHF